MSKSLYICDKCGFRAIFFSKVKRLPCTECDYGMMLEEQKVIEVTD